LKICFISHSARLGGAELVLLETIEILQESGVLCAAVLPSPGPLLLELEKLQVPVLVTPYALWVSQHQLPLRRRARSLMNIAAKSLLIAWRTRRWGCDIIYSNTSTVSVGALAAALLGLPHVWHVHELASKMGLRFVFGQKWSDRAMDKLSSLIIASSQAVAGEMSGSLHAAPCVIYPSLHRALRQGDSPLAPADKYRCVISGAICENKGQEDAVLAMAELKRRQVQAELLVMGTGDGIYAERLARLVRENQLGDCVTFLGQLEDPWSQLRSADVVLVCSRAEGFGRATAESMLAGKPVIGAGNSATAELIQDGCNGLLYRTGDSADLAGKIDYLYRHPEVAQRMAQSGQAWAGRIFNRERYRDQVLPLLLELLPPANWRAAR
jgi:glycosyltransferase involved in cell wall biosynthesis